jgi:prepilin-type N-terminal cleavage/methylation domain-containing protein
MRARLAAEDGFTLVELLAALVVGTIVLFAAFGLLDTAVRLQAKSVDGLDATDRGRVGIDQISQGFASRICLGDQPSLVAAGDSGVEFYASLAPESSAVRLVVQRRRLTVTGTGIREDVWSGSPPVAPPSLPPASTTAPTTTRMIVSGIRQIGSTPIFRYYANQGTPAQPTLLLATPLSAADLPRAVLIDVSFAAQGKRASVSTDYRNQIINASPTCVS